MTSPESKHRQQVTAADIFPVFDPDFFRISPDVLDRFSRKIGISDLEQAALQFRKLFAEAIPIKSGLVKLPEKKVRRSGSGGVSRYFKHPNDDRVVYEVLEKKGSVVIVGMMFSDDKVPRKIRY